VMVASALSCNQKWKLCMYIITLSATSSEEMEIKWAVLVASSFFMALAIFKSGIFLTVEANTQAFVIFSAAAVTGGLFAFSRWLSLNLNPVLGLGCFLAAASVGNLIFTQRLQQIKSKAT
jgi:hypothetical protein